MRRILQSDMSACVLSMTGLVVALGLLLRVWR